MSRFKVARLLDEAKEAGIVRIYVDMPAQVDVALGDAVAKNWRVRRVLVAKTTGQSHETAQLMMANLAADFLMSTVGPHDVLGISWGSSVAAVVDDIDSLPPVDVVQMVGGVRSAGLDTNGSELVRRLSHISGGHPFPLMAPLIVDTEQTAAALKGERAIAEAMSHFPRLTIALVGVGSWAPEHSSLISEVSDSDRAELISRGAVADMCGVVLTGDGKPVDSSMRNRTLSISFEQLSAVPTVVAVAGGHDKVAAVRASLASGLVDVLVTDDVVARELTEVSPR